MYNELVTRPGVMELTFQVFDRSVHPELIESVVTRRFERDAIKVKICLTPAGHLIEWRGGDLTLVETLADQCQPMPEQRQLFAHRVGGERSEAFAPSDRFSYQTCFQLERLPPLLFQKMHDELRRDGERNGILHLFHANDRLGFSPLSFVDLQARPGSILVHVYHTYPDDYAIVKSQSLVEVRRL